MNRTIRIAPLLTLMGVLFSCSLASAKPPNVVFILVDDLGWADVGCYGSTFYETPNIDHLAADGMKFTDAYAAGPVCSPTRASILTGKSPARLKMTNHLGGSRDYLKRRYELKGSLVLPATIADRLAEEEVAIGEALKAAGYATCIAGKWHTGGSPKRQGFDVCIPSFRGAHCGGTDDRYFADVLTDKAVGFIKDHKDGPFFLYLSHRVVHIPIVAKTDKVAKYKAKLRAHPPAEGAQDNAHYAAMVESVDDSVGRILQTLRRLKMDDRTVVIFFSDNGGLSSDYDGGRS